MLEDKVTEKVYCYDHPSAYNNHDALAIAAMANKGNGCNPMEMLAAMNGGMGANQWMNNPFIYLVFLMMFGRNGLWGNNGNGLQDAEIQSKLNQLSNQMQEGNNTNLLMDAIKGNANAVNQLASNLNCDFNALNGAICDVRQGVSTLSGQVGYNAEKVINSVVNGNLQMTQALKDCCCQTQQNIIKMGYENQLGQKDLENSMQRGFDFNNRSVERGFSAIGYQMSQDKCDIIRANQDNTQRIVDVLNNHWQQDLQQRYNDARLELSQQRQNATLIAALKTTTATT